jgi:uroporphyrinogen decarboxylase
LNPRERVNETLKHREPDRPPIDLGGTVSGIHNKAYSNLIKAMKLDLKVRIDPRDVQQLATPDEIILKKLSVDFRHVSLRTIPGPGGIQPDASGRAYFIDEWGIKWGRNPNYYDMIDHPLKDASINDLEKYNWPDPANPKRFVGLRDEAMNLYTNTEYAIQADAFFGGIYECAWWLRGFETFTVDMYKRQEFAEHLLNKILELYLDFYNEYLDIVGPYIQIIDYNDDIGMQTGPLLSPTMFKKYLKPRYDKIFKLIRSKTKAKIFLHTCGSVHLLIPDLIDIGLDILNPIQPLATKMDITGLKTDFGEKLCFHGGIDIQRLLPSGSAIEVAAEVKRISRIGGKNGGFILAGAHNIQSDVPPENVIAMFGAAGDPNVSSRNRF